MLDPDSPILIDRNRIIKEDESDMKMERVRMPTRGRGANRIRGSSIRGGSSFGYRTQKMRAFGGGYASEDEIMLEDTYPQYPNTIFNVQKSDRAKQLAISNIITVNFLKEFISDPLVQHAPKAPKIFKIVFDSNPKGEVNQRYVNFLKRKQEERQQAESKRKAEILRR